MIQIMDLTVIDGLIVKLAFVGCRLLA